MVTIYIIKCENGKYYVGKTNNIQKRLLDHFTNNGSEWTKMHKPIEILERYDNCDHFDEDKYTIKTMEKYGINNVRGGSFVKINLTESDRQTICKMISGATDRCFLCGKSDHFIADCPDKNSNDDIIVSTLESIFGKSTLNTITNFFDTIMSSFSNDNNKCYRCGKHDHWANECKNETSSGNEYIYLCNYCKKGFSTLKGATYHENVYCKKNYKNKNITHKNI